MAMPLKWLRPFQSTAQATESASAAAAAVSAAAVDDRRGAPAQWGAPTVLCGGLLHVFKIGDKTYRAIGPRADGLRKYGLPGQSLVPEAVKLLAYLDRTGDKPTSLPDRERFYEAVELDSAQINRARTSLLRAFPRLLKTRSYEIDPAALLRTETFDDSIPDANALELDASLREAGITEVQQMLVPHAYAWVEQREAKFALLRIYASKLGYEFSLAEVKEHMKGRLTDENLRQTISRLREKLDPRWSFAASGDFTGTHSLQWAAAPSARQPHPLQHLLPILPIPLHAALVPEDRLAAQALMKLGDSAPPPAKRQRKER